MTTERRALLAITDPVAYRRVRRLLERAGVDCGRALDRETALALGFRQRFVLVVSDLPMRGATLRDFLAHLTGRSSLSPGIPVVLYGLSPGAALFEGAGEIDQCRTLSGLLRSVARHLDLGDRVTRRLTVEIAVGGEAAPVTHAMQTVNLSPSGMLLRTEQLLPVGSVLPFVLDLPLDDRPVAGRVEVVRHADPGLEGLVGLGVRFLDFDESGSDRLARFVTTARA